LTKEGRIQACGGVGEWSAHAAGGEALRWWQEKSDPHRLVIEALPPLGPKRSLVVKLDAVVPEQA